MPWLGEGLVQGPGRLVGHDGVVVVDHEDDLADPVPEAGPEQGVDDVVDVVRDRPAGRRGRGMTQPPKVSIATDVSGVKPRATGTKPGCPRGASGCVRATSSGVGGRGGSGVGVMRATVPAPPTIPACGPCGCGGPRVGGRLWTLVASRTVRRTTCAFRVRQCPAHRAVRVA